MTPAKNPQYSKEEPDPLAENETVLRHIYAPQGMDDKDRIKLEAFNPGWPYDLTSVTRCKYFETSQDLADWKKAGCNEALKHNQNPNTKNDKNYKGEFAFTPAQLSAAKAEYERKCGKARIEGMPGSGQVFYSVYVKSTPRTDQPKPEENEPGHADIVFKFVGPREEPKKKKLPAYVRQILRLLIETIENNGQYYAQTCEDETQWQGRKPCPYLAGTSESD